MLRIKHLKEIHCVRPLHTSHFTAPSTNVSARWPGTQIQSLLSLKYLLINN
jgi:hypothetical protein